MAIAINTNLATASARALAIGEPGIGLPSGIPRPTPPAPAPAPVSMPPAPAPAAVAPPAAAQVFSTGILSSPAVLLNPPQVALPPITSLPPNASPPVFRPPIQLPPFPLPLPPALPAAPKTTTQLANGAIAQLSNAPPSAVTEAINAARSRGLDGPGLMTFLERKTQIRTVMEALARNWDDTTRNDFADAFQLAHDHFDTMDSMVSLAILNDRDLDGEIIAENTSQISPTDLMDNRTVVWQYPPPGAQLQPPYAILLAVEYRDIATADQILNSIKGQLAPFNGFNVPKTILSKLG